MKNNIGLVQRIQTEVSNYLSQEVEISPGVKYSQYKTIKRIYKFRNQNNGSKINSDLSYEYYFDIISPRIDSEVKNLRLDTKNILVYSANPQTDFAAVFILNAALKSWMLENDGDINLKTTVEEYVANGNVGFKRVENGYEIIDPMNTYITNVTAKNIDDTDIIERYTLTASQMKRMKNWNKEAVQEAIEKYGGKTFKSGSLTSDIDTTSKHYEIFEFTGEVSEAEYNEVYGIDKEGDPDKYFLAKCIVSGLKEGDSSGKKPILFAEKLGDKEKLSDYYIFAHRGRYQGRFWRMGIVEMLIDHQIRCNEIGNDIARGLEWASKVVFKTSDTRPLENIRADIENGDIIHNAENLVQLDVRMQGIDQLIADWNRVQQDADKLANSFEVVRGENMPSGTPFRMGLLLDQNAGKLFVLLRQKIAIPYRKVFREWLLPHLVKDLKGKDIFRFTGDIEVIEQLRMIIVESWYADNLVEIGPHTKEIADAIKQEKFEEIQESDPVIENTSKIWEGLLPRLYVTIEGEEYLVNEQIQDIMTLLPLEQDIERRNFMLDSVYKMRGLNLPPKLPIRTAPQEQQMQPPQGQQMMGEQQAPAEAEGGLNG